MQIYIPKTRLLCVCVCMCDCSGTASAVPAAPAPMALHSIYSQNTFLLQSSLWPLYDPETPSRIIRIRIQENLTKTLLFAKLTN